MSCLHEDIMRRSGEGATAAWPMYDLEHEANFNLCQSVTMWVLKNLESFEDEAPAYLDVFERDMYEQVRMYGFDPEGNMRTSPKKSESLGEVGGLVSGSLRRLGGWILRVAWGGRGRRSRGLHVWRGGGVLDKTIIFVKN